MQLSAGTFTVGGGGNVTLIAKGITLRGAGADQTTLQKIDGAPWVDPSTGATYTLPAKARRDAGTPDAVP